MSDADRLPLVHSCQLPYVQTADVSARLALEMRAVDLDGPVLIAAGNSAVTRLAPTWAASFAAVGWSHRVLVVTGESSLREITAIAAEATSFAAQAIVGVGGGTVLDDARAAAATVGLPFVACPTACSTAAASWLSVIHAAEEPHRGAIEGYELARRAADLVLVDTQVIAESPPRLFAADMGAALGTFYQRRAVAAAKPAPLRGVRDSLAVLDFARLCRDVVVEHGGAALAACRRRLVEDPLDRVVEAATLLVGLGFESAGLAAAHAVHSGLAAVPETQQSLPGERVAFGTLVQLLLEATHAADAATRSAAAEEAREVAEFCVRVGLPVTLRDLSIDAADTAAIAAVATRAAAPSETIHAMPFPVDAAAVATAVLAADALGRASRDRPTR